MRYLAIIFVILLCAYSLEAKEKSKYTSFKNNKIVGNSFQLALGINKYLITKNDSIYLINQHFDIPEFGQANANIKFGYKNDSLFYLYSYSDLSDSPCGDVWFNSMVRFVYDYKNDTSYIHKYIKDENCYNNGDSICNLFLDNFSKIEIVNLNGTNLFLISKNKFTIINDTIVVKKTFKPYVDAATQFATTAETNNFRLNGGFLLNTNDVLLFSNKTIFKYDTLGNLISYLPSNSNVFNKNIIAFNKLNDTLGAFLYNNILYTINSSLIIDSVFNFNNLINSITIVKEINNSIWVAGVNNSNDTVIVTQFDKQFNLLNTYSFALDKFIPENLLIVNDTLKLYGNEIVSPYNNEYALAIKTYYLPNIENNKLIDAAITNAFIDIYSIRTTYIWAFYPSYDNVFGKLSFTVSNLGADTINNVIVKSSFNYPLFDCNLFRGISFYLDSLDLKPNDSKTFTFDSISYNTAAFQPNQQLCTWTITPNKKIDKKHSNDAFCSNETIVKIIDKNIDNNQVLVYPNPTNSIVFLKSKKIIQYITVNDTQGKLLNKIDGNILTFDTKNLTDGIYIVNIYFEDGTSAINKLIKNKRNLFSLD